MEIKPEFEFEGLTERTKEKFYELAQDEWRRRQAQANETAMQPLLIRLDYLIRQIDLIAELLLLERQDKR